MNKKWTFISIIAVILALYVGMALKTEHPAEQLFREVTDEMNKAHVISFKSGFGINLYENEQALLEQELSGKATAKEQWQIKRSGTYDAWSKYLHYKNLTRYENQMESTEESEKKTSLSFETSGNMLLLPIKEAYFKNGMSFEQNRATGEWSYQERYSYNLIELLPFNAEVMNRYAKYYKFTNRMHFVVFFYSIDPNYLTRTFPDILETEGHTFPIRFKEGTLKVVVYPDTNLPRRIFATYLIENLDTGEIYEYNVDTYYSANESYPEHEEPAIPDTVLQYRR
ncbi:hypothetical protein [Caldalkalibacillus mannanilyticus]|uniref:hypothetical protein n=1 Tax=Caldalkalibacillus mannanilyticus TaxID=1418 RepID=UPI000468EED2|nr:hypothetical protein [Caldalkalibacillus mannanilyticus]